MSDLGYKSNHHSNTIIYLFELLHQLPEGDPNRNTDFIKAALKIAKKLHLQDSLIQEWSRNWAINISIFKFSSLSFVVEL